MDFVVWKVAEWWKMITSKKFAPRENRTEIIANIILKYSTQRAMKIKLWLHWEIKKMQNKNLFLAADRKNCLIVLSSLQPLQKAGPK